MRALCTARWERPPKLRRQVRLSASVAFGAAAVAASTAAWAVEGEASVDTALQFYDVRSPTGETVWPRRRLTTTFAVGAYDIAGRKETPDPRTTPEVSFRARFRYDADVGSGALDGSPAQPDFFVPGMSEAWLDLLYCYIEARRLFASGVSAKLGRQYAVDALGFQQFDGFSARVPTPWHVAIETRMGVEVRGGIPLNTARFEKEGVWRGVRDGMVSSYWPSFQASELAPTFGASVEATGLPWLHARASWQRTQHTGEAFVAPFATRDPLGTRATSVRGQRVAWERFGVSADAAPWPKGFVRGGLVADAHASRVSSGWLGGEHALTGSVTVGADYDFFQPTFDADSIFGFFPIVGSHEVSARGEFSLSREARLTATALGRLFGNGDAVGGGRLRAQHGWAGWHVGAHGGLESGVGIARSGGDVFATHTWNGRMSVDGRLSLWQWRDGSRPDREAVSGGYTIGAGYIFSPRSRVHAELDHQMNRLVGNRFRFLLYLTVAVVR
jgi:hypothetical protein